MGRPHQGRDYLLQLLHAVQKVFAVKKPFCTKEAMWPKSPLAFRQGPGMTHFDVLDLLMAKAASMSKSVAFSTLSCLPFYAKSFRPARHLCTSELISAQAVQG